MTPNIRHWLLLLLVAVTVAWVPSVARADDDCSTVSPPLCEGGKKNPNLHCQPCNNRCVPQEFLCILEPIPGMLGRDIITPAEARSGGAFFAYVNSGVWQWIFGFGVAMAVLNGTVGGLQIVLSNGDSGKSEAGKSRFIWATLGLIMLLLAGVILEFINPLGFTNV
jgi:hypothetical protein